NLEHSNFTFQAPISDLSVVLSTNTGHRVRFAIDHNRVAVDAGWVVDTSGRGKFLARKQGLLKQNPIRHGASWLWVEGLVNIERLTDRPASAVRLRPERAAIGHLPIWLATNHFCGEGFWFWVIPLQGKTSLGLVYDSRLISW